MSKHRRYLRPGVAPPLQPHDEAPLARLGFQPLTELRLPLRPVDQMVLRLCGGMHTYCRSIIRGTVLRDSTHIDI